MPIDFKFDVFLSHNAHDKQRVRRLAERLKHAGLQVWFDEWSVPYGGIIPLKVNEGLENSRVMLLCISQYAIDSGWVALERSTVIHRDPSNEGRRFIPLLLADCDLPDSLRLYKYIDYRKESDAAFLELLEACNASEPGTTSQPPSESERKPVSPETLRNKHVDTTSHAKAKKKPALPAEQLDALADISSPFQALVMTLSRVPGLKILFGVVAVMAILAIAKVWSVDRGWTIIGGIAVVCFAFVLLILAKFSSSSKSSFRGPATVLMWFSVFLFVAWGGLLTGCVFFKWPIPVSQLALIPAPRLESFDVTVLVRGEKGSHDLVLRNSGTVWMTLGADRRSEKIGDKGQADFKNIPARFRLVKVPISVEADGFEPVNPEAIYPLDSGSVSVVLKRQVLRVSGRVQDGDGNPVFNARVRAVGLQTDADATGHFNLTLAPEATPSSVEAEVNAPGFVIWRGTLKPNGGDAAIMLKPNPKPQ